MDDSTLSVLRVVYDLQFNGRLPVQPGLLALAERGCPVQNYFDPVPAVAIAAELWKRGNTIRASNRKSDPEHAAWSMPGTDMEVRTWHGKSSRMNYGG